MIKKIAVVVAGGVVLALTGCTSYVTVRPYSPPTAAILNVQTGLVYYLPKTLVDAKVTYSVYEENEWNADVQGNAIKTNKSGIIGPNSSKNVIVIDAAPEIQTVSVPDTKLGFALDPTDMVRFGVGIKDGKFEVNSDGMLTTAGVTFQDKSLETAQSVIKTGISLAKLAAVAQIAPTVKERKLLKQVAVRKILDLPDFTADTNKAGIYVYNFETEARRYLGQEYAPKGVKVPKAELILSLPDTFKKNASATSPEVLAALNKDGKSQEVHGIVTRIPAKARVQFAVDDLVVADSYQSFAQVGGFAFTPISSRRFTEYTTGVTVSPTAGSVTQFTINVTSAAAALSASGQTISDTTATAVKDFSVDQMNAETARLNAEANLIKARKGLEDAQK
jgi:hypothetical protein